MVSCLQEEAERSLPSKLPANKYTTGSRLTRIVENLVHYRAGEVQGAASKLFDTKQTDRFASVDGIRTRVISILFDRCFQELNALPSTDPDDEPKRRLKMLTALTVPGTPSERAQLLSEIEDGKTASFPYVLKYLSAGRVPVQPTFSSRNAPCTGGFTPALETLMPEASLVKATLQNYIDNAGILTSFMSASAPVNAEFSDTFQNLPAEIQLTSGGLVLPKQVLLERHREQRYRLPDGIVCAVGLTIVLESILRQAQRALGLSGSINARGNKLVSVLAPAIPLRPETVAYLEIVFGTTQMALRDAVSHGAFVANNENRIDDIVGGLTKTLKLLTTDLGASAHAAKIYAAPHWANTLQLDAAHNLTFESQFAGNLNLFQHPHLESLRKHAFRVLNVLTPDKTLLGRAAFVIWADLDGTGRRRLGNRPEAAFVGIVAALSGLEELFRAIHEEYRERILIITPDGSDIVRCEMSILDDQHGRLLDPAVMARVFGAQWSEAEFRDSITAVRALRDKVFHGAWGSLTLPKVRYLHLIIKLIITLCANVSFGSQNTGQNL
jgi:hypothetical protein